MLSPLAYVPLGLGRFRVYLPHLPPPFGISFPGLTPVMGTTYLVYMGCGAQYAFVAIHRAWISHLIPELHRQTIKSGDLQLQEYHVCFLII